MTSGLHNLNREEQAVDPDDPDEPQPGAPWEVRDLASLDWALSRIADLEREISENETVAAGAIRRIETKLTALNEKLAKGVAFFRSHVAVYATNHRAELLGTGKSKTRKLIHGSVSWRKSGGRLVVEDEAKLLAWAEAQGDPDLLLVKAAPALTAIRKLAAYKDTVPPGMVAEPEGEELKISTEES